MNSLQGQKKLLLNKLIKLKNENAYVKIYGVWHGRYNTDVFDINVEQLIEKLKKYFDNDVVTPD